MKGCTCECHRVETLAVRFAGQPRLVRFREEVLTRADSKVKMTSSDLYARYLEWCKENKEEPISHRAVTQVLVEWGVERYRNSGERGFRGLAFK